MSLKYFNSFLLSFLICSIATAQSRKDLKKIYELVVYSYYGGSPAAIIVTDSTSNRHIKEAKFGKMAEDYSKKPRERQFYNSGLDSTWSTTLRIAEKEKNNLVSNKIPHFQPDKFYVRLISKDSIRKVHSNIGFRNTFKVSDHVELSSVVLIKKRAIVELDRTSGSLNGDGRLFYLQKVKRKWKVVASNRTWVS